ncbi:MAG TPA: hypothetical protein VIW26_08890, partial [Gemmatimonadales bacterium]
MSRSILCETNEIGGHIYVERELVAVERDEAEAAARARGTVARQAVGLAEAGGDRAGRPEGEHARSATGKIRDRDCVGCRQRRG